MTRLLDELLDCVKIHCRRRDGFQKPQLAGLVDGNVAGSHALGMPEEVPLKQREPVF